MRKRLLLVFGTRPEAIKMAPVVHELRTRADIFEIVCCVTAQHRGLLDQVLEVFEIRPEIDLDMMKPGRSMGESAAELLGSISHTIADVHPDMVLVHGDTLTASAAAQAAFLARIPVAHVEAGLRTGDMASPFPEEANRRIVGLLADVHFAPTERNRVALLSEGVPDQRIEVTGNTVVDALHRVEAKLDSDSTFAEEAAAALDATLGFAWRSDRFVLITSHRRENFGDGLADICNALAALAEARGEVHFVFPVHPNPSVREPVVRRLGGLANVHLVDPLAYSAFVLAMKRCYLILTDSGGIQEEGPALAKPVLVMRDVTERPEAIAAGTVRLVGTDTSSIVAKVAALLDDSAAYDAMACAHSPYGDGHAALRIADALERHLLGPLHAPPPLSFAEAVR